MDILELTELLGTIGPRFIGLNTVYLFGSRAKGKPYPKDYDVAILADEGMLRTKQVIWELSDQLHDALHEYIKPLDVVVLNGTDSMLIQEVLMVKCVLFCSDKAYRVQWEARERQRAWDDAVLMADFRRRLKVRVGLGGGDADGPQAGGEALEGAPRI